MQSYSNPLQGFSWGGWHIPPSNPSIGSGNFPSFGTLSGDNPFSGWGSQMDGSFQSPSMPIDSNHFSLFGNLGSRFFPSFALLKPLPKFLESHARSLF